MERFGAFSDEPLGRVPSGEVRSTAIPWNPKPHMTIVAVVDATEEFRP
jgi:hypothetical protein